MKPLVRALVRQKGEEGLLLTPATGGRRQGTAARTAGPLRLRYFVMVFWLRYFVMVFWLRWKPVWFIHLSFLGVRYSAPATLFGST